MATFRQHERHQKLVRTWIFSKMSSFLRIACFLTVPVVFAIDSSTSATHVLEHTDACPDSGYYYRPADPGCYLCFCQNSTASCWKRQNSCGVQIQQIEDLPSRNRVRRSPISLSDIFFRDATRDFFKKQLPEQCKPHEGSFSDGCPPADWCVGCTVCDCDANGRWDCHILSFCNGEEKKKRKKIPLPKSMPSRRVYHKERATPKNHVTPTPKKGVKKSIPKPQKAQSRSPNGRRQNNNAKKPVSYNSKKSSNDNKKPSSYNNKPSNTYIPTIARRTNNQGRKPNNNKRPSNISKKVNKPRPNQKKTLPKARPKPKPKPTTKKPHTKRYIVRKKQSKTIVKTELPKTTVDKKKILKKRVTTSTEKPSDDESDEEYIRDHLQPGKESELGRKIVRKMMGTVQKMLGKQMEKLQRSRVERSIDEKKNCVKKNKNNKKASKFKNYMIRKNKLRNRKMPRYDINALRRKREALDLDLSIIDLNEANLVNDSLDFSVKRITKNITDFDFSDSRTNDHDITYMNKDYVKNDSKDLTTSDLNNNGSNTNCSKTDSLKVNKLKSNESTIGLSDNVVNNLTSNLSTNELLNTTAATQNFEQFVSSKFSTVRASSFPIELVTSTTVPNLNITILKPPSIIDKRDEIKTQRTTEFVFISKVTSTTVPNFNRTTLKPPSITDKRDEIKTQRTTEFVLISNKPEFKDLKHKKWERMKILRDSIIQINQISKFNNNRGYNEYTIDSSLLTRLRNKNDRDNLTKKFGFTRNHNLKKIINFKTDNLVTDSLSTPITPTDSGRNVSSLQVLLRSLIKELNNNTTSPSKLSKKFSLFKYLRNIFKKMFYRKKGKHFTGHQTNEAMTLQILCENIGACYLNKYNRITLRNKIHDLNAETEKIFKTIKIIKGLLYLIVLPVIKNNGTTKKPLKDEILKLDAILRGNYDENSNLTETQAAQINYVKDNIHQFVESVGKFATILNDILNVLYKNNKKYSCQRNLRFYNKKRKLNAFNKIKNLLVKYNIVQNTFMKNMFKLLTNVEKNMTTEKPKPKVSDRDINNTQVIDRYSKNIIQNLRKLKELAQALNSRRKKRHSKREDDAIEYLLNVMQHLLKHKYPLNGTPENDGIDLLIEAIQNAPDIKAIKKNILDEPSTTERVTRTISNLRYFNEFSKSGSEKKSKQHSNIPKNEEKLVVDESETANEETTQTVYYKRFDEYDNYTEFVTEHAKNISDEVKVEEKTGFDKFESSIDDTRRYEVFNSDLDDEPILPVVINDTNAQTPTTTPPTEQTTLVHDYKLDDDTVRPSKPKLEWIEDSFDKDIKDYKDENIFNITTTASTQLTTTIKPEVNVDNVSSITVEVEDERRKAKAVSDEVFNIKQKGFLNSLDYGTERIELEDSDLRDDEKVSGDFPSYFVK